MKIFCSILLVSAAFAQIGNPSPAGGNGTVTSVSVTTANGVSGSVATATTTPAITLTLGAITPTTVNALTFTPPASGATLTLADGKTFTVSNTLTFTGTDTSSVAFGTGGTVLYSGGALGTPSSATLTSATGLPMNGVVSATGAISTVANGNNPWTLNCAQTSNTQACVTFGETSAATGGSANNEVTVSTAANSTSTALNISQGAISTIFPTAGLNITQGSNTGATNVPALNIANTWNNSSLAGPGVLFNVTCTAAAAAAKLFDFQASAATAMNLSYTTANCGGSPKLTMGTSGIISTTTSQAQTFDGTAGSTNVTIGGGTVTASTNGAVGNLLAQGSDNSNTGASASAGTNTVRAGNITGAGTNIAGADLILDGGLGTSTGTPGHIALKTGSLGLASGTTQHTLVTRFLTLNKALSTTSATATSIFNVASATNTTWGVKVLVHVQLISSTPNVCGTTEEFSVTGTNNNGTFGTVNIVAGTLSTLCSAGTLTLAITATAANPSVVSITPTWATITSITSSTASIEVQNLSEVNDVTAASD